jgi:predicted DNA-binding protein YlxM (UPF0122 family)
MTQLKHLQDLRYHPVCKKIKILEEVFRINPGEKGNTIRGKKRSLKYWRSKEEILIKKYGAPSLTAFILYEHHFKGKTLRELGDLIMTSGQFISDLSKKVDLPMRSYREAMEMKRSREKRSLSVFNRLNKEVPSSEVIVHKYDVLGMSPVKIAKACNVSPTYIRKRLVDEGFTLKDRKKISPLKGMTFVKYFGEERAREIGKNISRVLTERSLGEEEKNRLWTARLVGYTGE